MSLWRTRLAVIAAVVALFDMSIGSGWADTITINDSGEGIPVITSDNPGGILPEILDNDFAEFIYISSSEPGALSTSFSRDLLEADGRTISDRLLVQWLNFHDYQVTFWSDGAREGMPSPGQHVFAPLIEDGTSQFMFGPSGGTPTDAYFVQSEVDVPELNAGFMVSALTALTGSILMLRGRRRCS